MPMTPDEYGLDAIEEMEGKHLDLPRMVVCADCGEPARIVMRDFGIGSYEFWGSKGYDSDERFVTECCDVEWDKCAVFDPEDET